LIRTKKLGYTDLNLTTIGLGTWAIGGGGWKYSWGPQDDHRRKDPHFQEPELSANLELVEGLRSIAERRGKTLAQLAIAWVLRRPEVTAAIVGARHPSQIEETASAGDWVLSGEDIAAIDMLLDKRKRVLNLS